MKKVGVLAVPLCLAYLGQVTMTLVDAALLGRYSQAALAGAGLANGFIWLIHIFGVGCVMGMDSLAPQAAGRSDWPLAHAIHKAGIRVSWRVGLPISALVGLVTLVLPYLSIPADVAHEASIYTWARLPGLLAYMLMIAHRSYLQARETTAIVLWVVVLGNVANLLIGYVFVFGDAGLIRLGLPAMNVPELGSVGAGLATSLVSVLMAYILGKAADKLSLGARATETQIDQAHRSVMTLGTPIGLHYVAEVGIFSLAALLATHLGKVAGAAHQVAITAATFSFHFALGLGSATAVRVGFEIGAKNPRLARIAGFAGISAGFAGMTFFAILFLLFPRFFAGLFTPDAEVIEAAIPLIQIAGVFQLFDGLQAISGGALRGAGDNRATFLANMLGHYLIAVPTVLVLGFGLQLGVRGIWWGLTTGLLAVGGGLLIRFSWLSRHFDDPPTLGKFVK